MEAQVKEVIVDAKHQIEEGSGEYEIGIMINMLRLVLGEGVTE